MWLGQQSQRSSLISVVFVTSCQWSFKELLSGVGLNFMLTWPQTVLCWRSYCTSYQYWATPDSCKCRGSKSSQGSQRENCLMFASCCHEGVTVCHDFALGGRSSSVRHAHRHIWGAAAWVSKVVLCASRWFSGHIIHPLASLSMIVEWSPLPLSAFTQHLYIQQPKVSDQCTTHLLFFLFVAPSYSLVPVSQWVSVV